MLKPNSSERNSESLWKSTSPWSPIMIIDELLSFKEPVRFIAETKGNDLLESDLRTTEQNKIECARRHFQAIILLFSSISARSQENREND